jgi:hypothetical protein
MIAPPDFHTRNATNGLRPNLKPRLAIRLDLDQFDASTLQNKCSIKQCFDVFRQMSTDRLQYRICHLDIAPPLA